MTLTSEHGSRRFESGISKSACQLLIPVATAIAGCPPQTRTGADRRIRFLSRMNGDEVPVRLFILCFMPVYPGAQTSRYHCIDFGRETLLVTGTRTRTCLARGQCRQS
jgi:hypothetical protein